MALRFRLVWVELDRSACPPLAFALDEDEVRLVGSELRRLPACGQDEN